MAAMDFPNSPTVGQVFTIYTWDGEKWVVTPAGAGAPDREMLVATRTYYVRSDGSDTNTGLANTAGGAFATLQKAYSTALKLDCNGFDVIIKIGNTATLTAGLSINLPLVGGNLWLEGDTTTPSNTVISTVGACISVGAAINLTVKHLKVQSSAGNGIDVLHTGALVTCQQVHSGAIANYCFACAGGRMNVSGPYTISGSQAGHFVFTGGGAGSLASNQTITLTGAPNFSLAFMYAAETALFTCFNETFSGAATGVRHSVSQNAVVNTFGGAVIGGSNSHFPGSINGTTATGGVYA